AIDSAEQTITFETFVYWQGDVGQRFADALAARARDGVAVHVLVDWVGGKMADDSIALMEEAGVAFHQYRPLAWYHLGRLNHRTHRKLLVVDGETGFTGGLGIADEWTGDAQDSGHWRDNHYRVAGPVVADMQRVFFSHCDPEAVPAADDERFFPSLEAQGETTMQVVAAEPADGPNRILHSFCDAIGRTRQRLGIVTPYFMPCGDLLDRILEARRRGVEVCVLTCGENMDWQSVRKASRHKWGGMLESGVRIFEYEPTLLHSKALIVDDREVHIGSANFDCRSCRINAEANLRIEGAAAASRHWEMLAADREDAHEVDYRQWRKRPVFQKLQDAAAHLFRDQL
ncbi:MAG: cardiolipin synthase B, partial [Akkermansiaceae bacterium]|nr:cardiolipin synthase B [Akkermansiaceae bacterium]